MEKESYPNCSLEYLENLTREEHLSMCQENGLDISIATSGQAADLLFAEQEKEKAAKQAAPPPAPTKRRRPATAGVKKASPESKEGAQKKPRTKKTQVEKESLEPTSPTLTQVEKESLEPTSPTSINDLALLRISPSYRTDAKGLSALSSLNEDCCKLAEVLSLKYDTEASQWYRYDVFQSELLPLKKNQVDSLILDQVRSTEYKYLRDCLSLEAKKVEEKQNSVVLENRVLKEYETELSRITKFGLRHRPLFLLPFTDKYVNVSSSDCYPPGEYRCLHVLSETYGPEPPSPSEIAFFGDLVGCNLPDLGKLRFLLSQSIGLHAPLSGFFPFLLSDPSNQTTSVLLQYLHYIQRHNVIETTIENLRNLQCGTNNILCLTGITESSKALDWANLRSLLTRTTNRPLIILSTPLSVGDFLLLLPKQAHRELFTISLKNMSVSLPGPLKQLVLVSSLINWCKSIPPHAVKIYQTPSKFSYLELVLINFISSSLFWESSAPTSELHQRGELRTKFKDYLLTLDIAGPLPKNWLESTFPSILMQVWGVTTKQVKASQQEGAWCWSNIVASVTGKSNILSQIPPVEQSPDPLDWKGQFPGDQDLNYWKEQVTDLLKKND